MSSHTIQMYDDVTLASQLDFEDRIQREGEIEMQVRQAAQQAASQPGHSPMGYTSVVMLDPPTYTAHVGGLTSPPPSMGYRELRVQLHPGLRGFARVLVAEQQIRDQLGIDLPEWTGND